VAQQHVGVLDEAVAGGAAVAGEGCDARDGFGAESGEGLMAVGAAAVEVEGPALQARLDYAGFRTATRKGLVHFTADLEGWEYG
jgi:hypothetical protein